LNRRQWLKELVFLIFLHLNINTTKDLKNPSFSNKKPFSLIAKGLEMVRLPG